MSKEQEQIVEQSSISTTPEKEQEIETKATSPKKTKFEYAYGPLVKTPESQILEEIITDIIKDRVEENQKPRVVFTKERDEITGEDRIFVSYKEKKYDFQDLMSKINFNHLSFDNETIANYKTAFFSVYERSKTHEELKTKIYLEFQKQFYPMVSEDQHSSDAINRLFEVTIILDSEEFNILQAKKSQGLTASESALFTKLTELQEEKTKLEEKVDILQLDADQKEQIKKLQLNQVRLDELKSQPQLNEADKNELDELLLLQRKQTYLEEFKNVVLTDEQRILLANFRSLQNLQYGEMRAIRYYTGDNFKSINSLLRGQEESQKPDSITELLPHIAVAAHGLNHLPDITLPSYQVIRYQDTTNLEELKSRAKFDQVYQDPAFFSTAEIGGVFSQNEVTIKGTNLLGKLIAAISAHPDEKEYLVPPSSQIKVTKYRASNNVHYFEVEGANVLNPYLDKRVLDKMKKLEERIKILQYLVKNNGFLQDGRNFISASEYAIQHDILVQGVMIDLDNRSEQDRDKILRYLIKNNGSLIYEDTAINPLIYCVGQKINLDKLLVSPKLIEKLPKEERSQVLQ